MSFLNQQYRCNFMSMTHVTKWQDQLYLEMTDKKLRVKPLMFHVEQRRREPSSCKCQNAEVLEKIQPPVIARNNVSQLHVNKFGKTKENTWKRRTFHSPARPPEAIPSSTTSMQTNGCLRLGACFRTWALANLSISLASPRGSNLSALWRLATHGFLHSKISKAHRRAVLTNWSGETIASTRPKS